MQVKEKNFLLTGAPGSGKTTLLEKLISELEVSADGFITREIREKGSRVGFLVQDLKGNQELLASINFPSHLRVGKYRVNLAGFEKIALPALERALSDAELVVIDEIGKMELFSDLFQKLVIKALDSPKPLLATILQKSHPFAEQIKRRPDVVIYKVSREKIANIKKELKVQLEILLKKF